MNEVSTCPAEVVNTHEERDAMVLKMFEPAARHGAAFPLLYALVFDISVLILIIACALFFLLLRVLHHPNCSLTLQFLLLLPLQL